MIKALEISERFREILERVPDEHITIEEIESLAKHVSSSFGHIDKSDLRNLYTLRTKVKNSTYTGKVYRGLRRDMFTFESILKDRKFTTENRRNKSIFESWSTDEDVAFGFAETSTSLSVSSEYGVVLSRRANPRNQIIYIGTKFTKNLQNTLLLEKQIIELKIKKGANPKKYFNRMNSVNVALDIIDPDRFYKDYEEEVTFASDRAKKYSLCANVERIVVSPSLLEYLEKNKDILEMLVSMLINPKDFSTDVDTYQAYFTCASSKKLKFHLG